MPGIRTLEGFVTILPGLQRPCLALECFTMIFLSFFLGGRAIGARDRALRPLLSPREIMFERGDVSAHRR